MNSEQERIVAELQERSAGAPFVFFPDLYGKRSALKESADLAWACNGCVVLFYMTKTKNGESKAVEHNLKQARRWLKDWRSGVQLTGKNALRSFSIAHDQFPHTVILSVVNTDDAVMRFHYRETVNMGVTICATVPEQLIHLLAQMRGSMVDLLLLLWGIGTRGECSKGWDAKMWVDDYLKFVHAEAAQFLRWPLTETDDAMKRALDAVYPLRVPHAGAIQNVTDKDWVAAAVFNDMSLANFLRTVYTIASGVKTVEDSIARGMPNAWIADARLDHMHLIVRIAPNVAILHKVYRESSIQIPEEPDAISAGRIEVFVSVDGAPMILAVHGRTGLSQAERVLNDVALDRSTKGMSWGDPSS